jgi:hypothetical protein
MASPAPPSPEHRAGPARAPVLCALARQSDRIATLSAALALIAVTALLAMVFWPGHMNLDTLGELKNAQTGRYTDWHSPVWSAIWRVLILIGLRSPGWMMAGSLLMLVVGLYLVLRTRLSRALAVAAAAVIAAFPPVLGWDVEIGTDSWFAAAFLCGFGFAARCARTHGRDRWISAALAVMCALLAQAARPTAAPAVLALLTALALTLLPAAVMGWRRAPAAFGGAAVATVTVVGVVLGVQYGVLRASQVHPEQGTYDYDLVAMSIAQDQVLLPSDVYPKQQVTYLSSHSGTSGDLDISPLLFGAHQAIAIPVEGQELGSLQVAWWAAIRGDPSGYLNERLNSALRQLTVTTAPSAVYYGPPPPGYGFTTGFPAMEGLGMVLVGAGSAPDATGGPLQRVWVYVLVLVAAAGLGWRRQPDAILPLLGVAALTYTLVVLLLSPGVTYRYMYPTVTAGTAAAVLLVAATGSWSLSRLRAGQNAPESTRIP